MAAAKSPKGKTKPKPPVEYSILYTATLCLLAGGAVMLYSAQLLAARPRQLQTLGGLVRPLLIVVGVACALLMKQPDMGTALVICFATGALLVAAGVPMRHLGVILGVAIVLVTFLAI